MSCNLHYASKYRVEYGKESMFNYECGKISSILEDFECDITPIGNHSSYPCEDGCDFCVSRNDIERMVESLKNNTNRECYGIPIDDLIYFFENAIKKSDKKNNDIVFSWF